VKLIFTSKTIKQTYSIIHLENISKQVFGTQQETSISLRVQTNNPNKILCVSSVLFRWPCNLVCAHSSSGGSGLFERVHFPG
jgi:hypothetical protein